MTAKTVSAAVLDSLRRDLSALPPRVAVAASGGVDSTLVLAVARELGREVVALSFMMDGVASSDFSAARRNASALGVAFEPVLLPSSAETIREDVSELVRIHGARSKTDVECSWPFLYLFDVAARFGISAVATGHAADGYFGISKKAMIHYRERLDEWRSKLFTPDEHYSQGPILRSVAASRSASIFTPYRARDIFEAFRGTTWPEINKPRQKEPLWLALEAVAPSARLDVAKHSNLHMGDSGIADALAAACTPEGSRSPVSFYNKLAKEIR